jgi:prevent-host-death family protein
VKTISVRDLQKSVKEAVDSAQSHRVVVTRRGKPAAVLFGVEGKDWETVVLETSSRFWELIEERRAEPTLSVDELERKNPRLFE